MNLLPAASTPETFETELATDGEFLALCDEIHAADLDACDAAGDEVFA